MGKHAPFREIVNDVKNRLPYLHDDWTRGFASGYRCFAIVLPFFPLHCSTDDARVWRLIVRYIN